MLISAFCTSQDTEVLLVQLVKDQEAVDQVREIVKAEETVMKKETEVVQDYADVSMILHVFSGFFDIATGNRKPDHYNQPTDHKAAPTTLVKGSYSSAVLGKKHLKTLATSYVEPPKWSSIFAIKIS